MTTTTQPRIDRVMVLSTAHVTALDAQKLDAHAADGMSAVNSWGPTSESYGWHVFVPETGEDAVACGMSGYFVQCLALARFHDCTFIRFDRDEEPVGNLAVHDW